MGLGYYSTKKGTVSAGLFGTYPGGQPGAVPTDWAMGYAFVLRKVALDESQIRFDEKMTKYAYAEDLDFSMRYCRWLKLNGHTAIYNSSIGVLHMATAENRLSKKENYIKVFVNRQYINAKLHGKSLIRRFLMTWTNFWYRYMCRRADHNDNVDIAYAIFKKHRKQLNKGLLDESCYE